MSEYFKDTDNIAAQEDSPVIYMPDDDVYPLAFTFWCSTLIKEHENRPTLQIKTGRQTLLIPFDEITRIEGLKDYIKIFCKNGTKMLSLMRMKNIISMLPEHEFERIHKSHIVSLSAITACDSNFVVVDGQSIPISNKYGKNIKEKWIQYLENVNK